MCVQTLWFSSQPGEKAIMRPMSYDWPTRDALTVYELSSLSYRPELLTFS